MTRLNTFLATIAATLFILAGAMMTYEVVARYFFIKPTIWAGELSQLCLIWGCLLGAAWALEHGRHIAVDAVYGLLSAPVRRVSDSVVMLIIAGLSAYVTWYGWEIFYDSFERGRTTGSLLNLPAWIAELSVPVGFALLFVQSLFELVKLLRGGQIATSAHAD